MPLRSGGLSLIKVVRADAFLTNACLNLFFHAQEMIFLIFIQGQACGERFIHIPEPLLQKSERLGLAVLLVKCKVAPAISLELHSPAPAEGLAHESFPAVRQVLNRMEEITHVPLSHLSQAGAIINSDKVLCHLKFY